MRVAEYDRYGPPSVLSIRERPRPTIRAGHVLVRVHAAALNPKDVLTRSGKYAFMAGRRFPKRCGYDWSGEAVEIGGGVTGISAGDPLLGMIQSWSGGACAEYVLVRADELAPKPAGLAWADAAALPLAGLTALQALRGSAEVGHGHRILINGASGGVGVFAVQIAKALGARVTALASERNHELVRSLGADAAFDYATWRPTGTFDAVFDVFGNRSFAEFRPFLTPRGTFVSTVPKRHMILAHLRTLFSRPRARLVAVRSRRADIAWLANAAAAGTIRAVIDREYPLDQIADAHVHVASKRTRGKVVISLL